MAGFQQQQQKRGSVFSRLGNAPKNQQGSTSRGGPGTGRNVALKGDRRVEVKANAEQSMPKPKSLSDRYIVTKHYFVFIYH